MTKKATAAHKRRFRTACESLNKLIVDMRLAGIENAQLYLANETLNLMNDETHDSKDSPQHRNIADSVTLYKADGGDW